MLKILLTQILPHVCELFAWLGTTIKFSAARTVRHYSEKTYVTQHISCGFDVLHLNKGDKQPVTVSQPRHQR